MEGIGFALAKIISERSARHGSGPVDFESVLESIVERTELEPEQAESLLWGEPVQLSLEETERLAEAFSLDGDLLSCILRPTSREILLHVLRSFEPDFDPACQECAFLLGTLDEAEQMSRSDLLQTCLDFLEHLSPLRDELAPGEESMLEVFRQLDVFAQARVLAYAYGEKAQSVDNSLQRRSSRFSQLRNEFLPPSARMALDYLAHRGGSLSLREIMAQTDTSAEELPDILDAALSEMALAGISIEEDVLLVASRDGGEVVFSFAPMALPLWQSMLQAESVFLDDNLLEN